MPQKKEAKNFIKSKAKPGATVGFRTSDFFRGRNFKPGGMNPVKSGFNPSTFKTQHKG